MANIIYNSLGIFFIIAGLYSVFNVYRVVFGGTKHIATVKRYDERKRLRGGNWYELTVEFNHNGNLIEKKVLGATIGTWKQCGEKIPIYFNEKIPTYAVINNIKTNIKFLIFIMIGLYFILR